MTPQPNRRLFVAEGQRFGRYVVVDPEAPPPPGKRDSRRRAVVRCDCGTVRTVTFDSLFKGATSCGCWKRERPKITPAFVAGALAWSRSRENCDRIRLIGVLPQTKARSVAAMRRPEYRARVAAQFTTHGMTGHPLYGTWKGMVDRCHNPASKDYPGYGARGISVCPAWRAGPREFIAWVEANIGPRPQGLTGAGRPLYTLDRLNNDGNYEPGNLRWATPKQQGENRRPNRRWQDKQQGRPLLARQEAAP